MTGASVSLNTGQSTQTGSGGTYSFAGLSAGNYIITASNSGYNSGSKSITLNAGDNSTNNDIQLTYIPASVTISLIDASSQSSISGNITLNGYGSYSAQHTYNNLPPGNYSASGSATGYTNNSINFSLNAGQNLSNSISLTKINSGTFSVLVKRSDNGKVVQGATVQLISSGTVMYSGNTDFEGVCAFGGQKINVGYYTIEASKQFSTATGYFWGSSSVTIQSGTNARQTISITKQ